MRKEDKLTARQMSDGTHIQYDETGKIVRHYDPTTGDAIENSPLVDHYFIKEGKE